MKTKLISLIFILSVTSMAVFIASNFATDRTRYKNDFIRIFPPHAAEVNRSVLFSTKHLSIAGITERSVYIQSGSELFEVSSDLLDTCRIEIENPKSYGVVIDSPYFYLQSGTQGVLQRGNLQMWRVDTTYSLEFGFIAFQSVSKNSFVFQSIDNHAHKSIFIKSTIPGSRIDILQKQYDGVICTDGFFQCDRKKNLMVYAYRYRNQVIFMDTSLNITGLGKTIDTTSIAKISVTEIDGNVTMSKPPLVVNKAAFLDGQHLFVHSNLVARNELSSEMLDRSVIDVYSTSDGSYRYSFYVLDVHKTKMLSFKIRDTTLFAVFPNQLVKYTLASTYLRN